MRVFHSFDQLVEFSASGAVAHMSVFNAGPVKNMGKNDGKEWVRIDDEIAKLKTKLRAVQDEDAYEEIMKEINQLELEKTQYKTRGESGEIVDQSIGAKPPTITPESPHATPPPESLHRQAIYNPKQNDDDDDGIPPRHLRNETVKVRSKER